MSAPDYEVYAAKRAEAIAAAKKRQENMDRQRRERRIPRNTQLNLARLQQAREVLSRARDRRR